MRQPGSRRKAFIPYHPCFHTKCGRTVKTQQDHYTGEKPAAAATEQGIELAVVKLAEAKRGFVLLLRRWIVERSFAWLARFRRLSRDYERLPTTLAGLH